MKHYTIVSQRSLNCCFYIFRLQKINYGNADTILTITSHMKKIHQLKPTPSYAHITQNNAWTFCNEIGHLIYKTPELNTIGKNKIKLFR